MTTTSTTSKGTAIMDREVELDGKMVTSRFAIDKLRQDGLSDIAIALWYRQATQMK